MHVCALFSPPSRSSTRGLRRRVARRPQRVLNTAAHFTACKAIISIPTPPTLTLSLSHSLFLGPPLAAGTAESAHLHMESGSLNRDVIDLPLFVRGKCSQTSLANFAAAAQPWNTAGLRFERREKKKSISITVITHFNHQHKHST